ncbi:uncharacterized protein LOC101731991 isoform X1 [Xenopus tropicalis]|uniref:Uncharacterized protein LOC101731991 isoform X1 n=2 Tax=Xenopus tropicalis TaxID=8364 RepID=A0A8J0T6D1_XENTR|nr:uncharacterized protein LOC101731991 isoform X1 [Xenopus tropicalis]
MLVFIAYLFFDSCSPCFPQVTMEKFSNPEFLREFIELYQSFPCLWKVKSGDYMNRIKRDKAYAELISLCKSVCSSADLQYVKTKIANLRTVFKKEMNKVQASKKSGASADDIYVPRLWYYDLLVFTVDQEVARDSRSNFSNQGLEKQQSTEASPAEDVTDVTAQSSRAADIEVEDQTEHLAQIPQSSTLIEEGSQHEMAGAKGTQGRNRKRKNNPSTQQLLHDAETLLNRKSDEFDAIGFTVASKLRRMDEEQRQFAEYIINEALHRGFRKTLRESTRLTDYTTTDYRNYNSFPQAPLQQYPPNANMRQICTPPSATPYEQQTTWTSMLSPIPPNNGHNNMSSCETEKQHLHYSHL